MITQEDGRILCREGRMPWPLRLFALVLALGCGGMIPAVFLFHLRWDTPPVAMLLVFGCVAFALYVGGMMLLVALVRPMVLVLDPATGEVTRARRGDLRDVTDRFRLADLPPPQVVMRDSEEGIYPVLRLALPRGRAFEVADLRDRAEAEQWRDRIDAIIKTAR